MVRRAPKQASGALKRRADRAEAYRDWAVVAIFNHFLLTLLVLFQLPIEVLVAAALLLGIGFALGAVIVLHDAAHHRFSRNYAPNMLAVHTAAPIGFWAAQFILKHRVHHRLPAAYPYDEFTQSNGLLRLHPQAPLRPAHRYQHLYAWFLYFFLWPGDMLSQLRYLLNGEIAGSSDKSGRSRIWTFGIEKSVTTAVLLPYLILGGSKLVVPLLIAGFFGGFLVACVLVVGHVNIGLQYDKYPGAATKWPAYVAATTASFSTDSFLVAWFTGGLTHHLAHHLRPAASRKDLRVLHEVVTNAIRDQTHVSSVEFPTFRAALSGHLQALKGLGTAKQPAPPAEIRSSGALRPYVLVTQPPPRTS